MKTKNLVKILMIVLLAMMPWCAQDIFGLPQIEEVVNGEANVTCPDANTMDITAANNTIINYSSFSIMENERVNIILPSSSSEILNRVTGSTPSQIMGSLQCNGILILVNPSGIYVGPNANINAASLIMATRDITNNNFLNKDYLFRKISPEALDMILINNGNITIHKGGFGVLIAGAIHNNGIITAKVGTIALASGNAVRLELAGNRLISVAIEEPVARTISDLEGRPITEQIKNTGTLDARGGTVVLKAESINDVFTKAINLEGVVKGSRLEESHGVMHIVGEGEGLAEAPARTVGMVEIDDKVASREALDLARSVDFEELTASKTKGVIYIANEPINIPAKAKAGTSWPNIEIPEAVLTGNTTAVPNNVVIAQAPNHNVPQHKTGYFIKPLDRAIIHLNYESINSTITIREITGMGSIHMSRAPPAINFAYDNFPSKLTNNSKSYSYKEFCPIFNHLYHNNTVYSACPTSVGITGVFVLGR